MGEFLDYICRMGKCVNFIPKSSIHIVMGNESCDLDSTICSLVWAYFLDKCSGHKSNSQIFPVLNITLSEFPLRTENCFVLQKFRIDWKQLIYRDTINLRELQNETDLKITLVDHHVLSKENKFLSDSVIEIYDHRPFDGNVNWNENVRINTKQVGSCATLIADEIYKRNADALCETAAKLLYNTVIFDTIGLNPQAGKAKELDLKICQLLEKTCKIEPEHKILFDQLWFAHNDVSHLSPLQLLSKDLKTVENVLIPGLPMLVFKFLEKVNVAETLKSFSIERNALVIVLMGLEARDGNVFRDIALYSRDSNNLLDIICKNLTKFTDLHLAETVTSVDEVKYFIQNNVKLSRKQILPVIKDSCDEYESKLGSC